MLRRLLALVLALGLVLPATDAFAQQVSGTLSGRVLGNDGELLPGITVTLEPVEPPVGSPVSTITQSDGTFRFTVPHPGRYRLEATAEGFAPIHEIVEFTIGSSQEVELRFFFHTVDGGEPEARPAWNKWAVEESPDSEPGTGPFLAQHTYVVTFDLAGIDYDELVADPTLAGDPDETLKKFLATKTQLTLLAKPFLQGEGLSFVSAQEAQKQHRVVVQLDRVRKPADFLKDLSQADRKVLSKVSAHLSAARFDVKVHADKAGEARVSLFLWDADTRQPLDLQTFRVTIEEEGDEPIPATAAATAASSARDGFPVSDDGLQALLGTPSSLRADAGIAIFELEEGVNRVVFLGPQNVARSWAPRRSIREFVSGEGPNQFGLVRQLQSVHCPSPSPLFCREDYSQVSSFFSGILFSDPNSNGRREAQLSREELELLVGSADAVGAAGKTKKPLPLVATRFIDKSGKTLPIPLGLLGLSGNRLLGNVAHVTQPLPTERPVAAGSCISDFNTLVPTTLGLGEDDCERADLDELLRPIEPPASSFISDFAGMQSFFSDATPRSAAQGFLLLAHHADGFVSLSPGFSPALLAEEMTRRYGEGSAAVLIGCAVGGLSPLNRSLPLVSALNDNGVDAMIFSPFSVNAELGSRLAIHFSAALEQARRSREQLSLFELYTRALAATREDPTVQPFLGELAEFSLAGRGDLKLCPAPPAKAAGSRQDAAAAPPGQSPAAAPRSCCCCRGLASRLGGPIGSGSGNGGVKGGLGLAELLAVVQCAGRSGRCNCTGN